MPAVKKPAARQRPSLALVLMASIMLLLDAALIILGVAYMASFGWFSAVLILAGVSSGYLAIMSLITGKPEWLLLDLILPN